MARRHLKRLAAPKSWGILRKEETFITRPNPGAHTMQQCMPLSALMKRAGYVKTTREAKKALLKNSVLVDGRRRLDPKSQAGLFDEIKISKDSLRVLIDTKGHLITVKAPENECGSKPCKVTGKTAIRGGKIQANLSDGRNMILDTKCAVGDTLIVTFPKQSVKEHHKLEAGAFVLLTGGKHVGECGTVTHMKDNTLAYKNQDGEEYTTLKEYAFVLGRGKPCITMR